MEPEEIEQRTDDLDLYIDYLQEKDELWQEIRNEEDGYRFYDELVEHEKEAAEELVEE